jgi:hypothetical protein
MAIKQLTEKAKRLAALDPKHPKKNTIADSLDRKRCSAVTFRMMS